MTDALGNWGGPGGMPFANNAYDAVARAPNPKLNSARSIKQSDKDAIAQNELDYMIELRDAERVVSSRFRWEGGIHEILPPQYLEKYLFWRGRMIAFNDDKLGPLILQGTVNDLNIFFEPATFQVWGNEYERIIPADECVDIRDNPVALPPLWEITRQAWLIADMKRALQNNINTMKKTNIIRTNNFGGTTEEFIAKAKLDNLPYIIVDSKGTKKPIEDLDDNSVIPLTTSNDIQAIANVRLDEFNTMLSKQGINTNMQNKSQYRNKTEITGDTSHIELVLRQAEHCREMALAEMKDKLGWSDITLHNVYKEAGEEAAKMGAVGNEIDWPKEEKDEQSA